MRCVADSNVKYPIKLLQQIIEKKQQYKFKLTYSTKKLEVSASFLELLAKIFTKQEDAETYKLYEDMKDDIAENIKRKSGSPVGVIRYVAREIVNIGNSLKK